MGLFIPALWFEDKEIKAATHVLINLIQASLKCGSVSFRGHLVLSF